MTNKNPKLAKVKDDKPRKTDQFISRLWIVLNGDLASVYASAGVNVEVIIMTMQHLQLLRTEAAITESLERMILDCIKDINREYKEDLHKNLGLKARLEGLLEICVKRALGEEEEPEETPKDPVW